MCFAVTLVHSRLQKAPLASRQKGLRAVMEEVMEEAGSHLIPSFNGGLGFERCQKAEMLKGEQMGNGRVALAN